MDKLASKMSYLLRNKKDLKNVYSSAYLDTNNSLYALTFLLNKMLNDDSLVATPKIIEDIGQCQLLAKEIKESISLETNNKLLPKIKRFNYLNEKITLKLFLYLILPFLLILDSEHNLFVVKSKLESEEKYAKEIEAYDNYLDDYVANFNNRINNYDIKELAKELNICEDDAKDILTFMILMDDAWKERTYGKPLIDAYGYYRIDMTENKCGVCRSISDDMTAKLNAINPSYNARNLIVYANLEYGDMVDIERNIQEIDSENNETENEAETEKHKFFNPPNHLVTLVDIKRKNVSLVLDPTNLSYGILKNGKIYIFNCEDTKYRESVATNYFLNGICDTALLLGRNINSFFSFESKESIEEIYNFSNQQKTLNFIRR